MTDTAVNCDKCPFRAKYDQNPKSILGRLWRWHINWCPGWKKYMLSKSGEERKQLALTYDQNKFLSK